MDEQKKGTAHHKDAGRESELQQAADTLESLTTSPAFSEYLQNEGIDISDQTSDEYLKGIHSFSKLFLDMIPHDERTNEHQLLELSAMTPYATRQSHLLSLHQEQPFLLKDEKDIAKNTTIEYGTVMAEYMARNPDVSIDSLSDTLSQINVEYTEDDPIISKKLIHDKVRGVRVEYAFYELMQHQGFLPIRRGTIDEDRKGIDFVATPPNGPLLYIDIKASLDKIAEQNGGYQDQNTFFSVSNTGKIRLFPLLHDSVFEGDTCRVKDDMREMLTGKILIALQQAAHKIASKH